MRSIDVSDLPERFQRALAEQAERIRARLAKKKDQEDGDVPDLHHSDLGVKGEVTRADAYEDRG
jgi:hypothetical protein